jgi:hypothetical protein
VPATLLKKCKSPSSFTLLTSPAKAFNNSTNTTTLPKSTTTTTVITASAENNASKRRSTTPDKGLSYGAPHSPLTNTTTSSNHEDSLMSSAHSMIGSDSLSQPLSPALSKVNISNIENFNDLTENKKEDDFLFQIGRRGRAVSEFMNPQAVCANSEFIYVTDSNNQKIEAFGHNGEYKFSLGWNSASGNSKIRRPIGIDCTSDGKILVVDYEFKCVNVYEENGKLLNRICQNRLLGKTMFFYSNLK